MKVSVALLVLGSFLPAVLPAINIGAPQSSAQIRAFRAAGKKPHKVLKHRARKHRTA